VKTRDRVVIDMPATGDTSSGLADETDAAADADITPADGDADCADRGLVASSADRMLSRAAGEPAISSYSDTTAGDADACVSADSRAPPPVDRLGLEFCLLGLKLGGELGLGLTPAVDRLGLELCLLGLKLGAELWLTPAVDGSGGGLGSWLGLTFIVPSSRPAASLGT